MEKARRRRHVPAFGEWNYYSSSSSPDEPQLPPSGSVAAVPTGLWYAPEPEACSDVWFRYSPPARRPAPKKARRPAVEPEKLYYGGGNGKGGVTPVARTRASGSSAAMAAARTPARGPRRVVRPVDADLYQVPPPLDNASGRSRRKKMWMGCLGLNCVA